MRARVRCARCNNNPRNLPDHMRPGWKTLSLETYDPKIVNAKVKLAEHRNEQRKVDFATTRRSSISAAAKLPRRRKSVFVSVSLEDSESDEEEGAAPALAAVGEEGKTPESFVPLPSAPAARRQSVWDRLTDTKSFPASHALRFDRMSGEGRRMSIREGDSTEDIPRNQVYPSIPKELGAGR